MSTEEVNITMQPMAATAFVQLRLFFCVDKTKPHQARLPHLRDKHVGDLGPPLFLRTPGRVQVSRVDRGPLLQPVLQPEITVGLFLLHLQKRVGRAQDLPATTIVQVVGSGMQVNHENRADGEKEHAQRVSAGRGRGAGVNGSQKR